LPVYLATHRSRWHRYRRAVPLPDDRHAGRTDMVSKDGKSAGHIDDITMAGGMTLRLPKN
jgi:hypothetical protein